MVDRETVGPSLIDADATALELLAAMDIVVCNSPDEDETTLPRRTVDGEVQGGRGNTRPRDALLFVLLDGSAGRHDINTSQAGKAKPLSLYFPGRTSGNERPRPNPAPITGLSGCYLAGEEGGR